MPFDTQPYDVDRIFRLLLGVSVVVFGFYLLVYLSDVLLPCAIAFLLAYLLNPVVSWIQRRVGSRVVAVLITFFGFLVVTVVVLGLAVPLIAREVVQLAELLKTLVSDPELLQKVSSWVPPELIEAVRKELKDRQLVEMLQERDFWALVSPVLRRLLPGVWSLVTGTTSFLFSLFGVAIVLLYLFFFLMDFEATKDEWLDLLPERLREPVLEFIREFDRAMGRYFRGQGLVASLVGVLFAIGFYIIGLPFGIVLGLGIGLMNMVPYLQLVGIFPVAILAILQAVDSGGNVWLSLGLVGLVFVVVQAIQDAVLVPRIMGKVTGLSPAMILLSISVWGKLLGFLGLIIAIPMTCLLQAYWIRLKNSWRTVKIEGTILTH